MKAFVLKYALIFLMLSLISLLGFGQHKLHELTPEQVLENRGEIYFRFMKKDFPGEIKTMGKYINIDRIDDDYVYAFANANNYKEIKRMQLPIELLYSDGELYDYQMYSGVRGDYNFDKYPTYEAYVQMMHDFAKAYPSLCKIEEIGTSTDGRKLLVARLSSDANEDNEKPNFLYTSSMHGDETVGIVLMLRLIDYLLTQYGQDARVNALVDNMVIWINPMANPDGTYRGGNHTVKGAVRHNANYVDLNRNYPDIEDGDHPDGQSHQMETQAFMEFADKYNIVMAANFHSGCEVVNYPWDTWGFRHADNDWYKFVSREYADTCQKYSGSHPYMRDLDNGITNGYDWYTLSGGRQDYMNYFKQCREITVELSGKKILGEDKLLAHWDYNYLSLLQYMEQAMYGLGGVVVDKSTGKPIADAKISVLNHDVHNSYVYSLPGSGKYYRPIFKGVYDVVVEAPCYIPDTIWQVNVENYKMIINEVSLTPNGSDVNFSAEKRDVTMGETITFIPEFCVNPTTFSWEFEGGIPSISLEENPKVTYPDNGMFNVSLAVQNEAGETFREIKRNFVFVAPKVLIKNDSHVSVSECLFFDDGGEQGNYANGKNYVMTFYPETDCGKLKVDFIEFNVEYSHECIYDKLQIYDGESVNDPLFEGDFCGNNSPGVLTATNEKGALTFRFYSDNTGNAKGWKAKITTEGVSDVKSDFEASERVIDQLDQVQYTSFSLQADKHRWHFPGGTPLTSEEMNPQVIYNVDGEYDVQLIIYSNGCDVTDTLLMEKYIQVNKANEISEIAEKSVRIYPNPMTDGVLTVQSDLSIEGIMVFNMTGELFRHIKPNQNKVYLDLTEFPCGIYILKIQTPNHTAVHKLQKVK